jgi:predicted acylesterase/phospholipase RssA
MHADLIIPLIGAIVGTVYACRRLERWLKGETERRNTDRLIAQVIADRPPLRQWMPLHVKQATLLQLDELGIGREKEVPRKVRQA